jgi:hypothetical protein
MVAAGVAWMVVTAGLNVAVLACAPSWVKARALATYLLVFQGTLAGGSLLWGFAADRIGDSLSLRIAAGVLAIGVLVTWRWRLDPSERVDLTPVHLLPEPQVDDVPGPEEGPMLVTAEYRVELDSASEFVMEMRQLGRVRRRDGAMQWGLFRDPAQPGRYIESFVVESWAEYLRQMDRATLADEAIDERARSFLTTGEQPTVTHLVAARGPDDSAPVTSGVW